MMINIHFKICSFSICEYFLYQLWYSEIKMAIIFLMLIKTNFYDEIKGSIDQHDNVRDLLKFNDEQSITFDKSLTNTIIMYFLSLKVTEIKRKYDQIIRIRGIMAQLKVVEVTLSDSFITLYFVHFSS